MTGEEREFLYNSIRTAPNLDELKARFIAATRLATRGNDSVCIRILTDLKEVRKVEINDGF